MFKFSEIHDWQEDPAVKQILVFPSQLLNDEFEKEYALRVKKDGKWAASDSNIGAIYKIRAVKNGNDMWDGVVRCGLTGELLIDQKDLGRTWNEALVNITNLFKGHITESCNQLFISVFTDSVFRTALTTRT